MMIDFFSSGGDYSPVAVLALGVFVSALVALAVTYWRG
jgi:preprotein translocase subunit Sec61beta